MSSSVWQASKFSRTRANEAKMGAYYTDLSHCRDIAKMFNWPQGEEVCVLEPSIGDGSAVITVTGADQNPNVKIYGVELNDEVAKTTAKNPHVTACVKADFLDGFASRHAVFSFCFANPPYLSQVTNYGDARQRTEKTFLDKIGDYLKRNAILVWVVPFTVFSDASHVRMWIRDYETLALFKFRGSEYEKFHQIVAVGRRRTRGLVSNDEITRFIDSWINCGIRELPTDLTPQISVMPSQEKAIDLFTTRVFDKDAAAEWLGEHGLGDDLMAVMNEGFTQKAYLPASLGRPPIPLKKDSEYLLLTSGFTDGLVGDEDEGNLHLMRGVASVVDHERIATTLDEETDEITSQKMIVTSSTEVEVRILESNGRVRLLGGKEKKEEEE